MCGLVFNVDVLNEFLLRMFVYLMAFLGCFFRVWQIVSVYVYSDQMLVCVSYVVNLFDCYIPCFGIRVVILCE